MPFLLHVDALPGKNGQRATHPIERHPGRSEGVCRHHVQLSNPCNIIQHLFCTGEEPPVYRQSPGEVGHQVLQPRKAEIGNLYSSMATS